MNMRSSSIHLHLYGGREHKIVDDDAGEHTTHLYRTRARFINFCFFFSPPHNFYFLFVLRSSRIPDPTIFFSSRHDSDFTSEHPNSLRRFVRFQVARFPRCWLPCLVFSRFSASNFLHTHTHVASLLALFSTSRFYFALHLATDSERRTMQNVLVHFAF